MKALFQCLLAPVLLGAAIPAHASSLPAKADSPETSSQEIAAPPVVNGKGASNRIAAVPEPSVIVPLVCGMGALLLLGRRRG